MPIIRPQVVIIKGKRFASMVDLEDNRASMTAIAEELIDLANFEMTCHAKVLSFVLEPTLNTHQDLERDGVWTRILVVIAVDEESSGQARIVEI